MPRFVSKFDSDVNGKTPVSGEERLRSLLFRAFFSRCTLTVLHADPHPGNLFYLKDGRVALTVDGGTLRSAYTADFNRKQWHYDR